jgi:hypothetical protein
MTKGTRMFTIYGMKPFRWSADKNEALQKDRHVSFEAMVVAIEAHGLLDVLCIPMPRNTQTSKCWSLRAMAMCI